MRAGRFCACCSVIRLCRRRSDDRGGDRGRAMPVAPVEHHPHLMPLADRVLEPPNRRFWPDMMWSSSLCRTAIRRPLADQLGPGTVVIDCGADFRLADAGGGGGFYGSDHAGTWPTGCPNCQADVRLRGATRIAVPGCYPTAALLALVPAVGADLADPPSPSSRSADLRAGRRPRWTCWPRRSSARRVANIAGAHRHTRRSLRGCGR